jgi:hypothetical protein
MYPYGVIFVGHALGAAVVFEYQLVVAAAVLAGYALWRYRRGVLPVLAGALPPALFLAAYHTALFGKPWALPWEHVTNPGFAAYHAQGFLGLTAPRPAAVGSMLFAPDLGLFVFSPFLALGAVGAALAAWRGRRAEGVTILAVCAAMLLFISSMTFWRGGWCAGPRYITVTAPFLACGVAHLWRLQRNGGGWRVPAALTAVLGGAVIVSVVMSGVSAVMFPHYPPQYENPVFELTLPLIGRGFAPYSVGTALGLHGAWSLAPVAAVLLAAVALGLGGEAPALPRRLVHGAAAVAVACALLLSFSRLGHGPSPDKAHATAFVESIWEPRR